MELSSPSDNCLFSSKSVSSLSNQCSPLGNNIKYRINKVDMSRRFNGSHHKVIAFVTI